MKKSLVGFLVMALLCVLSFSVFASEYNDVSDNFWGEEAIESLTEEGITSGDGTGNYRPDDTITRAEFVTLIVNLFEPTATADLSQYKDVRSTAWYYEAISKAVAMGAVKGYSETVMGPEGKITRQEAIVIINRIIELSHSKNASIKKFADASDVANWALDAILTFAEKGFVNGYADGSLQPEGYITRAESAQIIHNAVGKIITKPGEYNLADVNGVVVVKCEGVVLKNADEAAKVVVTTEKVAKSLKTDTVKAEDVTVINEENKTDDEKKDDEKKTSSGGGGSSTPIGTVVINDDGTYYTFKKKSGTVAAGSKVKFVYGDDEELIINETITKNSYEKIVDAVLAKLTDTDKLMKTLSDKYSDEELSNKLGSEAFKDVTDVRGTILEVYNALKALDMSDEDIISAIKAVVTYDDVKSALTYIK